MIALACIINRTEVRISYRLLYCVNDPKDFDNMLNCDYGLYLLNHLHSIEKKLLALSLGKNSVYSISGWDAGTSFFRHVAVMFVRKDPVEGVEWDICVPSRFSVKHVVVPRFCRGCVFLKRSVVLSVDKGLMWMDVFRATRNISKERKGPPKTVRTPENVERVHFPIQTGGK
ncbi:UNVERIFIED_CONTAM: hypothetical protein NCL1_44224 [Trichonephila clavipes]